MGRLFRVVCLAGVFASVSAVALAADVGRLEWGNYVVESDSSNGYQEIAATSSDDGYTMNLTFSALEARADGSTQDSKASVAGHFDVSQPKLDSFTVARIKLEGHVIKSSGSVAKVVLKVAGVEKTVEWLEGSVASEKYSRSIDVALPVDGRLPSPFPVAVETIARKIGYSDAAYVSVSGISMTAIEAPKVASRQ